MARERERERVDECKGRGQKEKGFDTLKMSSWIAVVACGNDPIGRKCSYFARGDALRGPPPLSLSLSRVATRRGGL